MQIAKIVYVDLALGAYQTMLYLNQFTHKHVQDDSRDKYDGEIVYYLYLRIFRPSVTKSLLCIPVVPGA